MSIPSYRAANPIMASPNQETRRNALQRLFQVKQRDEMLCKSFSKQNNAMKCFAKTFPSKTTRRNALQKLFQAKQCDEMLCKDFSKQNNATKCLQTAFPGFSSNPFRFSVPVPGRRERSVVQACAV